MAELPPRQKPIRARIARFPYLTGERNEAIDVSALPRWTATGQGSRAD